MSLQYTHTVATRMKSDSNLRWPLKKNQPWENVFIQIYNGHPKL